MAKASVESLYFKGTPEFLAIVKEADQKAASEFERAKQLATEVGGDAPVFQDGRMVGVHFEGKAPDGWKNIPGAPKWERYFRPLISKGHRDLADRIASIRRPTWSDDVLSKVNLAGHLVIGEHVRGQGFRMLGARGHRLGSDIVVEVPVSKKENGDYDYSGHPLLIPISKADFLQLQADFERSKEQVAA